MLNNLIKKDYKTSISFSYKSFDEFGVIISVVDDVVYNFFFKKGIKDLEIKRSAYVLGFFLSSIVFVNIFPFIVYTFPFHLILSLFYTWKIFKWELKFINNYNLNDCNPEWKVRTITTISKFSGKVIPVVSFFSIGSIIGIDTIYEKHYGESAITKLGKIREVYKNLNE